MAPDQRASAGLPHPLDELKLCFGASDVDAHLSVRHIDTLVEKFRGDEHTVVCVGKLVDALANDSIFLAV